MTSLTSVVDSCTISQQTYFKLSKDAKNGLIRTIKFQLKSIVEKHFYKGSCSFKEAKFLLSNLNGCKIPHFYIIWKILKDPIVRRPTVTGYNWILTPASIFVGHILKEFYSKFDTILTDSVSLFRILESNKFNIICLLFTIDFKSLYTLIPVEVQMWLRF